MFNNKRYITRGVSESISESLQLAVWNFIDLLKLKENLELDYLQVFELRFISSNSTLNQEITHSQEVPPYKKIYLISTTNPVNAKIYVIDDVDHSTMLLAEEY